MNFQFSATNLHDLEPLITTLFATNRCACHVINPAKTRILLWKEVKDEKTTYYLRIGIQKFISQEQVDRNGEIYWKFENYVVSPKAEVSKEELPPSELDPVTKFNQRQTKSQELNPHAASHPNSI